MNSNKKLEEILAANKGSFHPVVPYIPGESKFLAMNFTASNEALTDEILRDFELFAGYVDTEIKKAGALYGIGGYNEHRTVYKTSRVFDGENAGDEPRRLHLGVDIWGKSGTAIMSPLDAEVHSIAFNERKGDYGATVILKHQLAGITFYSLYGHLSLASLDNKREGAIIEKGDTFAWFGTKEENGYWPPHLHIQLIKDPGEWRGDYPGVCKFSARETFLENCPDPELILNMQPHTC